MYSKSIQLAKGSIFPIIATTLKDGKQIGRQVAGTGFFINDDGFFATALHVVNGDKKLVKYGSLGNIPYVRFKAAAPETLVEIGRNANLDLYVGKLETNIQNGLQLIKENPVEGTSIIIGGYPFPNILKTKDGSLNFFTVRQYWQSTMIMDYLNMTYLDRRLKYKGFLVDKRTIPGMSGGPALNLEGGIIGMCTAQITRTAKDKIPNVNGVCLDATSLYKGIGKIMSDYSEKKLNS